MKTSNLIFGLSLLGSIFVKNKTTKNILIGSTAASGAWSIKNMLEKKDTSVEGLNGRDRVHSHEFYMEVVNLNNTDESFRINPYKFIGESTKSLYVRKGFKNGTLFLSQRGQGGTGAGDVCPLNTIYLEVKANLFSRIKIFAEKCNAFV